MEQPEPTTPDDQPVAPEEVAPIPREAHAAATPSPPVSDEDLAAGDRASGASAAAAELANPSDDETGGYQHVYAIGRIEPRFPTLALEKEFAQATSRAETEGLTDRQALHEVLTKRENRYLARQLCYVLTIEGLDTYILQPRDPTDVDLLVEAIRPAPSPLDVDVVVGMRGPIASPELCNGLMVPIVAFDQIYSFDRDSLIKSIPRPEGITAKQFEPAATDLFERIIQVADNAGATDEHRALNYVAVRYPGIYARAAEEFGQDFSLTGVDVLPSPLGGVRAVVEIVFSYTNRNTDFTEKFFVRVDVTEEFPFLVTKLSPYYDR